MSHVPEDDTPSRISLKPGTPLLSPLRYPGGKRRLVSFIAETIRLNNFKPELLVEPFAGGASVSLQLLCDGVVERVALGEKDPLVASFWRSVFWDTDRLVRKIRQMNVTVDEWDRYRAYRPRVDHTRAEKCLFLNRTSFSGILSQTAGPIGGREQKSDYGIGCRFPKDTIIKRIWQASAFSDRIAFVHEGGWQETVARAEGLEARAESTLYYFDPPFYEKADRLYRHYFQEDEHRRLRDGILDLAGHFILSYDPAEAIARLYQGNGHAVGHVDMLYSAKESDNLEEAREMIVTDLPRTPDLTRLWRSKDHSSP